MTIDDIIKAGSVLCGMIFDFSKDPRFSRGEAFRLNSLGSDISSAVNLIAAIDADSDYFSEEDSE